MKVDRWEEYQTFFQLIILRYLVVWFSLVPVLAGLVSQLPDPLPITLLGVTHEIELTLPFSWQLLWVSSLFFVLALALYKAFCPKFVQKYSDFSSYSQYEHHPRWLSWEAHGLLKIANIKEKIKFRDRLLQKKYIVELGDNIAMDLCDEPSVQEKQTEISFRVDDKSYKLGMPIIDGDCHSERDVFYEIFGRYSESRWHVRLIIKMFLIVSFILFVVTLVQHIYEGGVFVWSWISGLI